jgi:hypothetical protein
MAAAPPANTMVRVTATGGMPGWQITLIAAIAAILAAATAVLPGRATPPGGTPQRQPPDPTTHPKPGTPTLPNRLLHPTRQSDRRCQPAPRRQPPAMHHQSQPGDHPNHVRE